MHVMTQEPKVVNGRPTKIDVDKLISRFGVPEENETILWKEIEDVTGLSKQEYRFGTVLTAWRKHLEREYDILLYAIPGVGLAVADGNTKIDIAARKIELGDGQKRKWVERAYRVKSASLDETRKDTQGRILTAYGAMLRLTAATAPKSLPVPK